MLPPVAIEPQPHSSDSKTNTPFYTYLTFACKTETLDPLYSHVLMFSLKFIQVQISSGA